MYRPHDNPLALAKGAGYLQRMSRHAATRNDPVETLVAQSLAGLARWAKQPPAVRFRAMVRSGLIDERGNVRSKASARTIGELTRDLQARKRRTRTASGRSR